MFIAVLCIQTFRNPTYLECPKKTDAVKISKFTADQNISVSTSDPSDVVGSFCHVEPKIKTSLENGSSECLSITSFSFIQSWKLRFYLKTIKVAKKDKTLI